MKKTCNLARKSYKEGNPLSKAPDYILMGRDELRELDECSKDIKNRSFKSSQIVNQCISGTEIIKVDKDSFLEVGFYE